MYSYGGYNQICNLGDEVKDPTRTIPRSIVLATLLVAAIYMVMTTVIVGMIPWTEVKESRTIASLFIQRTFSDPESGRLAGIVMTGLILFVAASSLYALILGYSRIPYAAARDGNFFAIFRHVHPSKHFPDVSLATIAIVSIPFCFFSLGQIVSWLVQVQVLLQFIWQCAAVVLLRRYRSGHPAAVHDAALSVARRAVRRAVALHLLHRAAGRHRVLVRVPAGRRRGLCHLRPRPHRGGD